MTITNLIINVNKELEWIKNHIRKVGISLTNPFNIIDNIKDLLNNI